MCLISKQSEPYIAKTHIVIYKLVMKNPNGGYISPFRRYPYELNKVYEEVDNLQENSSHTHSGGWFHSFRTYRRALLAYPHIKEFIIVTGIIPKGTLYYLGMDGDICSKKIIIKKEIK